jgi:glutamate synthase domain-containing protein 1/glutamate synthase domain-containing protein 3
VSAPPARPGFAARLTAARGRLLAGAGAPRSDPDGAAEGGCGVIGLACEVPVAGRHLLRALAQMRNRGNGKGGGVALVGLDPAQFGVDRRTLAEDYLLAVAYLDPRVRDEVEERFVTASFTVDHVKVFESERGNRSLFGFDVDPPEVVAYFVRPRPEAVDALLAAGGLTRGDVPDRRALEDELVYQNSFRLNLEMYASERGNRAYVQSHGKDLLVLKMVGYAEDVIRYYRLEEVTAHVWIGHHRYPTKGRVWHPGGAHPFVGLNEALVHNGDFANYQSICDYLAQRNIRPLFMTDTEVAALVYDLHRRVYRYPLEYVIESLAPTTERDFALLPAAKQGVYRALQRAHLHGSPDGPWFFIIAENDRGTFRLLGITDTSMLRPQVFALQRGEAAIALCASEKQVIDAALGSLAEEDPRFWSRPDRTWVARGGSHTDGGAFLFTLAEKPGGGRVLTVTDKFGAPVTAAPGDVSVPLGFAAASPAAVLAPDWQPREAFAEVAARLGEWGWEEVAGLLAELRGQAAAAPARRREVVELLTLLIDRRYATGRLRRSRWLCRLDACLAAVVADVGERPGGGFKVQGAPGARPLPEGAEQTLVLDARRYPPEGPGSVALELVALARAGWRRFAVVECRGHRFIGCGFGADADGVRIDVYGAAGDYFASGADGLEVHLHGDGQDQLAQIFRRGTLVVHGDVGQAFGYGAKGGAIYVLGNAAGRPMINAVGAPRVVINGTCLDYLAESFMAGDPLTGGGFVILNAVRFDDGGALVDLPTPYPGGNLFSLASGGALYVRDPRRQLEAGQLNGGEFVPLGEEDWRLITPHLEANAAHFGIPLARLLAVDGRPRPPAEVYRKVRPVKHKALHAEETWARGRRRR